MGSINIDNSGNQHHWMDAVREWKPKWWLPKKRKKLKSMRGQLGLFDKFSKNEK